MCVRSLSQADSCVYLFLKGGGGMWRRFCLQLPVICRQGMSDGKRYEWLGTANPASDG